jgi:hypothetical protein
MKKILVFALVVLALGLVSTMTVNLVNAEIESTSWLGSFHSWGKDDYYDKSVYGYEENSEAMLLVEVKNHLAKLMNVSAIIVGFDWGKNYTTTLASPVALEAGETRFLTATITVPNTTIASNLFLHGYTVYVKHVNATGGLVGTMTKAYTSDSDRLFAVYSKDQADARKLSKIISGISAPTGGFNSTAAILQLVKADNETTIAETLYKQGDFAGAKTHYTTALNYINQAFVTEQTTTGGVQDAQLALIEAQARSYEATANYLNGLSSMWVLIGVAAVLFAIGYIIRGFAALRKPLPPP